MTLFRPPGRALPFLTALAALFCLLQPLAVNAEEAPLAVEDELILDVRLDGRALGIDVLGYQRDGDFLVSLAELMDALEFPINVDPASGQAGGWFIQEERDFTLDLDAGEVESDGRTVSIEPGQVVVFENDLYVDINALQQWLPLRMEAVVRELVLSVEPTESIPLQARMARSRRTVSAPGMMRREPEMPLQETPYRLVGPRSTDLRFDYSNVRRDADASPTHDARYSLLSRGDLGWMTSTLSLTGRDDDEVSDGRFRLEREQVDGPLNLNHFEVGDVSSGGARGALVRGGPARGSLDGRFTGESIDLRGDILPDWEVELYRNDVLVDFQVVGDDGQYEFLDVPLELGENRFEFVFFGPFGEERREKETYFVGPETLGFGQVNYELAALQAGRSVFDVGVRGGRGDRNTGRYLGKFNFGLTRNAIARFAVDSFEQDGERIEYYDAGLSVTFARLQASTSYNYRPDQQDSLNTSLQTRLNQTRLSLGYTDFNTNRLDSEAIPDNLRRWRGTARLSSRPLGLPVTMDGSHTQRVLSSNSRASLATTLRAGRNSRFSKSFSYQLEDERDMGMGRREQIAGSASIATTLRPWRLRTGFAYDIEPETELRTLNTSASLRVDRSMTMNFDVRHNRIGERTTYRAGFNWQLDALQISPRVTYSSDERWAGLISISTSISPQPGRSMPTFNRLPHANTGAARARVFIDHDGDGVFSEGDEPVEGVRVDAVQAFRNVETGKDGQAYLTRLRRHRQTDVVIDPGTIPDLELEPQHPGRSIKPRPGSWSTIDFPLVRTTELEGYVYREELEGEPASRIRITLVDEDGEAVARQRTAFDGFYLFASVPPGEYRVRVEEAQRGRVEVRPDPVTVGADGGIVRDLDFVLRAQAGRILATESAPQPEGEPGSEREPAPIIGEAASGSAIAQPQQDVGNWHIQLGAFSAQSLAEEQWSRLKAAHPELLDGFSARFEESAGLTRLLAQPGLTESAARALCQELAAVDVDCLVRELGD